MGCFPSKDAEPAPGPMPDGAYHLGGGAFVGGPNSLLPPERNPALWPTDPYAVVATRLPCGCTLWSFKCRECGHTIEDEEENQKLDIAKCMTCKAMPDPANPPPSACVEKALIKARKITCVHCAREERRRRRERRVRPRPVTMWPGPGASYFEP